MLRISSNLIYESGLLMFDCIDTKKMFSQCLKRYFAEIPKSLLMLLSLPLLETIITISFNHNTTGLVTFSNVSFACFLTQIHIETNFTKFLRLCNLTQKFRSMQPVSNTV